MWVRATPCLGAASHGQGSRVGYEGPFPREFHRVLDLTHTDRAASLTPTGEEEDTIIPTCHRTADHRRRTCLCNVHVLKNCSRSTHAYIEAHSTARYVASRSDGRPLTEYWTSGVPQR